MENKPKAFPVIAGDQNVYDTGMDLRDYFAAKAMQGIIASTVGIGLEINKKHIETISKKAFMYADAMLKERNTK